MVLLPCGHNQIYVLMLRLLAVLCFTLFCTIEGFSQFKVGAGANFIFDESFFGVGGRAMYDIDEDFAVQGQFTLLLDDFADYIIELDVFYQGLDLGDVEGFQLTPFAGLNIFRAGIGGSDTGLTIGIQGLTPITDGLDLYIEPKLYLGGASSFAIAGGVYF